MGNIATGLVRAPLMRSQAALLQARMAEQEQLAQEGAARTLLLTTQANQIKTGDDRIDNASKASATFMQAQQAYKDNPTPENKKALESATTDFSGTMATFKDVKVGELVTALGKTAANNELSGSNPNMAVAGALQGGAASVANNQADNVEKAARPIVIPQGGAAMSPTGNIMAVAPANIRQDEIRVGETNEPPVTPIATGTPKPAAGDKYPPGVLDQAFKMLLQNSSGGTNTDEAISNLDRYIAQNPNAPAAANPATGTPQGGGPAMVRVLHPDGSTTGMIPAANLPAALKAGYQQLQ